jgi:hypothetical protein
LGEENYRNTALFSLSLQRLGSYDWMAIGFGKPFGWIRRFGIHSKIVREMIVFAIFHPLLNYLASSSSLVVVFIKSPSDACVLLNLNLYFCKTMSMRIRKIMKLKIYVPLFHHTIVNFMITFSLVPSL